MERIKILIETLKKVNEITSTAIVELENMFDSSVNCKKASNYNPDEYLKQWLYETDLVNRELLFEDVQNENK